MLLISNSISVVSKFDLSVLFSIVLIFFILQLVITFYIISFKVLGINLIKQVTDMIKQYRHEIKKNYILNIIIPCIFFIFVVVEFILLFGK